MKKIGVLFLLLLVVTLSACAEESNGDNGLIRRTRQYYNVFDSQVSVAMWSNHTDAEATDILNDVYDMLWDVHEHSTKYDSITGLNNVYYLNNNPDTEIVVDPMLIEMIELSTELYNYELSQGMFNIALGKVLDVWSTYRNRCADDDVCQVPDISKLESANAMSDPNLIVVDKDNSTVIIPEGMKIDLGGIAKGYGASIVGDYLREIGVEAFLIDAGSSNIEVYGINPNVHRDFWSVGLRDPDNINDIYARISLDSGWNAISSGDYERYYNVEGDDLDYHHLINPQTLMPAWHIRTVTVIAEDPMLGDLYSTIAFLLAIEDAIAFIDSLENVEAIWLDSDRNVHMSANMEALFLNEILID